MVLTCVYFCSTDCINKSNLVFSAFLDSFKTFCKTKHNLLITNLIKCNVPLSTARRLVGWYRNQTIKVKGAFDFRIRPVATGDIRGQFPSNYIVPKIFLAKLITKNFSL